MSDYTQTPPQSEASAVVYVEKPRNGLAVAAMVLGIVALLFVWIPFLNAISLLLAVIAIGLGIPALIKAKRVHKGMGPAVAGVVLAVVSAIGFFAVNAFAVDTIDEAVVEFNDAIDATDEIDVTVGTAEYDGFSTDVPVTVVNIGEETMSFIISFNASSPDGATVYDTASVATPTLTPGQTWQGEAMFLDELPADAVVEMSDAI